MAERKVISISVDPSTYFRLEVLSKRLSRDIYEDVSKSMVIRIAVRKMYEQMNFTEDDKQLAKIVLNSIYGNSVYIDTDTAEVKRGEKDDNQ